MLPGSLGRALEYSHAGVDGLGFRVIVLDPLRLGFRVCLRLRPLRSGA